MQPEETKDILRQILNSLKRLVGQYHILLQVDFYNEKSLSLEARQSAYNLCKEVDPKDAVFVALSSELDAPLWTGDKKLKKGLLAKRIHKFL